MKASHMILCLALFLAGAGLQAQETRVSDYGRLDSNGAYNLPQVISPDAASIAKVPSTPVDYYHGRATVNIPLTSLPCGNYQLNVSLSYTTGGIRLYNHPGWIGEGWTLEAGGCINRIIRGSKDDECLDEAQYKHHVSEQTIELIRNGGKSSFSLLDPGYFFHMDLVQNRDWTSTPLLDSLFYYPGRIDLEPDEFQVDVADIKGTFYFTPNGIIVSPERGIHRFRVEYEDCFERDSVILWHNNSTFLEARRFHYFKSFTIISDAGVRYSFGGEESSIDFSYTQSLEGAGQRLIGTANTWHLTRIDFPNGDALIFRYEKDGTPVIVKDVHTRLYYIRLLTATSPGYTGIVNEERHGFYTDDSDDGVYTNLSYTILSPSYLRKIESKYTGRFLRFHRARTSALGYEANPDKMLLQLGDMKKNLSDPFTWRSFLTNDYFCQLLWIETDTGEIRFVQQDNDETFIEGPPTRTSMDIVPGAKPIRLRLLAVLGNETNGNQWRYNFKYAGDYTLPRYNSKLTDHWGYFNGMYYGAILSRTMGPHHLASPYMNDTFFQKTLDQEMAEYRAPNPKYTGIGSLTEIRYPTGGYTKFIFEPNEYHRVVKTDPMRLVTSHGYGGGLRIKEIIDSTDTGKERRVFDYLNSGILSSTPVYGSAGELTNNAYYVERKLVNGEEEIDTLLTITGNVRMRYGSENCLEDEFSSRQSNVNYGMVKEIRSDGSSITRSYSNFDTEPDEDPIARYETFSCPSRLDPVISHALRRGLLLKQEFRDSNNRIVREEAYTYGTSDRDSSISAINRIVLHSEGLMKRVCINRIYWEKPILTEKETKHYSDDSDAMIVTHEQYEYDPFFREKEKEVHQGGSIYRETHTFAADYETSVYPNMEISGRGGEIVETIRWVDGMLSEAELTTWKQGGAPGDFVPSERYRTTPNGIPVFTTLYDGVHVDDVYGPPLVRYLDYDAHSNLTQSATPDGTHTSYTWDQDSTYLRGVFVGAERKMRSRVWSEQARVTEEEELSDLHDRFYGHGFTTVADGPVTVNIWFDAGDERDIWGRFDEDSLLSFHCPPPTSAGGLTPMYTCTFQLPAGQHRLALATTQGVFPPVVPYYPSPGAAGVTGEQPEYDPLDPVVIIDPNGKPLRGYLSLTYWGDADYVHVRDEAECAHFSFEDTGDTADGFQSTKSQTEQMTVHLVLNPDRNYTMDRRVKRNGEWVYEQMPFQFNSTDTYTLHAGGAPFDEVRIYADGVQPETCTWWPDGNLRSRTDARGVTESYEYDGLGRLVRVTDNEGKKVAEYTYNYQNR